MAPLYACLSILQVCCRVNTKVLSRIRLNDCYKVSKFHASEMLVSLLRCFKFSSLTTPPHSKPGFICLLWGEAEVRVAFNDRAERYRSCNLVTERDRGGVCHPQSKPRLCLFAMGKAEVRVALYPLGTQNKRLLYFGRAET